MWLLTHCFQRWDCPPQANGCFIVQPLDGHNLCIILDSTLFFQSHIRSSPNQHYSTSKTPNSNSITKTLIHAFITSHLQWSPVKGTQPNPRQTLLFQITKPLKHFTPTFIHLHWFHVKFTSPMRSSSSTEPSLLHRSRPIRSPPS